MLIPVPSRLLASSDLRRGLALLALISLTSHASAQESHERRHLVRGQLDVGKLLGAPQSHDFGVGFGFGLSYEYRFHDYLGVGADYGGHVFPIRVPGVSGVGTFHGVGPSLDVHPIPHLELGDLRVDLGPDLVVTGGTARFGLHVGATFDFRVTDSVSVGPFVRYRHAFSPSNGQTTSDPKLLTFGAELQLAFGRAASEPVAETPRDSDSDGIVDASDACIDAAEDMDGNADTDGCPESEDADSDGIVDASDACPNDPETPNGFEDADGCPDAEPVVADAPPAVVPAPVEPAPVERAPVVDDTSTIELPSLGCDVGVAEVHTTHEGDLDGIAQTMRDHPSLRIVVIGHADPVGTAEYNDALSHRRASHVRGELIRRGIDGSRIRVRWVGEHQPVDSGTDDSARANNRRVQIVVED